MISESQDALYASGASAFDAAVQAVKAGATPESQAKKLYDQLTDDERLGLLDGDTPFWEGMTR